MLWVRDANLMLALRFIQALGLRRRGDLAGDGHRLLSSAKNQPDFRRHYAAGRFIAGAGTALDSWLLVHFEWRAIFCRAVRDYPAADAAALRLKPANKTGCQRPAELTFLTLLRSREYSGNVLHLRRLFRQLLPG